MLLLQHHQDGLAKRLIVIGIPHYALKEFISLIVKWERCSGVEWTIKRLKSLKIDLIRRKSHLLPLTWIRKNRRGDVAGTIGSLFRWSDKSDENFEKCVQVFMAYTFYVLPFLTEEQKSRFLSAINPTESEDLSSAFMTEFSSSVSRALRKRSIEIPHRPLVMYMGSPEKRAPRLFSQGSVPQSDHILDDLQFMNTDGGLYLYCKYHRLYKPLLQGIGARVKWLDYVYENSSSRKSFKPSVYGGEIHFLQEPGGKLRSVASPFRIHQEALRPLGQSIYDVVHSLPWDCTFDQSKAIPHIQSHLSRGGRVHSIDLSSATDHFPLSLQMIALKTIFNSEDWDHLELFQEISRGRWKSSIGDLQWTKGQPLGLYPSFGAFTLTHGLLLWHLNHCHHDNQFFVVGDDVVILNDALRNRYISMLDQMRCPWSGDKSLSSSELAEFAGKIISSERVIPQMKWRVISDDNFLDLCRLLGRRSRSLLTDRQKRVYDRVANLCDPIGLNFSLPGDNLEKMVTRTLEFYHPVETVLGSLMGLRKNLNQLVHNSSEDFNSDELKVLSATFDEKVKSAMILTVFKNFSVLEDIGLEGFESLPEALGLRPRLPLKKFTPVRWTTLQRYERLL